MTSKERHERVAKSIRYHLSLDSGVDITEDQARNAAAQFVDWLVQDAGDEAAEAALTKWGILKCDVCGKRRKRGPWYTNVSNGTVCPECYRRSMRTALAKE